MKIHDEEDRDDAPDLPGRDVLDAWTVPPVGADLSERVLGHVETALSAEVVSMQERRRGGYGLALVGVAMVAAAALVLGLVQLWQAGPREQAPLVAAPVVVRVPVPVPAPIAVEPPVVAAATLRIGTASGYGPAKVFVDGKAKGTTPLVNIAVTPGRHTVKWVWSEGESDEVVVTLDAGQTQVLKGPTGQLKGPYR